MESYSPPREEAADSSIMEDHAWKTTTATPHSSTAGATARQTWLWLQRRAAETAAQFTRASARTRNCGHACAQAWCSMAPLKWQMQGPKNTDPQNAFKPGMQTVVVSYTEMLPSVSAPLCRASVRGGPGLAEAWRGDSEKGRQLKQPRSSAVRPGPHPHGTSTSKVRQSCSHQIPMSS